MNLRTYILTFTLSCIVFSTALQAQINITDTGLGTKHRSFKTFNLSTADIQDKDSKELGMTPESVKYFENRVLEVFTAKGFQAVSENETPDMTVSYYISLTKYNDDQKEIVMVGSNNLYHVLSESDESQDYLMKGLFVIGVRDSAGEIIWVSTTKNQYTKDVVNMSRDEKNVVLDDLVEIMLADLPSKTQ